MTITTNDISYNPDKKIIRVYNTELAKHFERKGFEIIGILGDDVTKPKQYTLYGDKKKITKREACHIEKFGELKDKREQIYV